MADSDAPRLLAPAAATWAERRAQFRQWRRYWIRDPLLGGVNYALLGVCRRLPLDRVAALGNWLGVFNASHRFEKSRRRTERYHQTLAGSSEAEAADAVLRLFGQVGSVMVEFSVLDRLWPEGRIEVAGKEHLLDARAAGKPVIVMGLHLGNWETIGPTIVGLGFRGAKGFYQPPRSRFEHRIIVAARNRYGAIMLQAGVSGARAARRHLVEERGVFLIYADEERAGYVGMPLFGRPVPPRANVLNIIKLAWASGAVVLPAYCERLGGARFRVTYLPPVDLVPEGDDADAALLENVDRIDRIITPLILAHLDQWYMLMEHRVGI